MTKDYQNAEQDRRITWLENHYSTFNDEMGEVKRTVGEIKTDIGWVKKLLYLLISLMITGFGTLGGILLQHILLK